MASLDVSKLKVADLKSELQARGLPVSGLKAVLATRLQEALDAEGETRAADAPPTNGADEVEEGPGGTDGVSADRQDAPEVPGPTELIEPATEPADTRTDGGVVPDIDTRPPVDAVEAPAPSEVVEPSRRDTEPAEGLIFHSTNDDAGAEGPAPPAKRKRDDEVAAEPDARDKVEPPAVQAEEALMPNDAVPTPPADVAAKADPSLDDEREPKRPRVSEEPALRLPPKPGEITIRGASLRTSQSPVDGRKASHAPIDGAHTKVEPSEPASVISDSPSFFIANLSRPCPDGELEAMIAEHGKVLDFYVNKIKTHAIVTLSSAAAAASAIQALHGLVWPEGGRSLDLRSIPSAHAASDLISTDRQSGGRNRFILHIDATSGNASLRTPTTPGSAARLSASGPRGLASSLPAALAASAPPLSSRPPPPAPVDPRVDIAAGVPAVHDLHRPLPRGGLVAHFKVTEARPPIYYCDNKK